MLKRSPEKMHRLSDGKNDWDDVADNELNVWQKIAKKTHGVGTLANTITLTGSVLVINGLFDFMNNNKALGLAKFAAGRACDVIDGEVADATKTKGKLGRDLDPTMDTIQLAVALPVLESIGVIPLAATVAVAAPKVVDSVATLAAKARGREINPESEGKLGATAIWVGLGAFMLRGVLDRHLPGVVDMGLETAGWTGTVGGTLYKMPATLQYVSLGFGSEEVPEVSLDQNLAAETE